MILSPPHILFVALSATIANVDQVRMYLCVGDWTIDGSPVCLAASPVYPPLPITLRRLLIKPNQIKNNQVAGWIGSVHGPTQMVVSDFRPVPLKYHFIDNEGMYVTFVTFKCDACVSAAAAAAAAAVHNHAFISHITYHHSDDSTLPHHTTLQLSPLRRRRGGPRGAQRAQKARARQAQGHAP